MRLPTRSKHILAEHISNKYHAVQCNERIVWRSNRGVLGTDSGVRKNHKTSIKRIGMTVLQPEFKWATFCMRVKRVTIVLAHYVEDIILGFDFMTKCHYETASRLNSVVI